MKKLLLPVLFMLFMALGTLAQSPTPSPTPTDAEFDLMQRAQMVAEIKMLREKNAGLQTQVSELKTQVYDIVTGKQIGRASCRERVCQYV